MPAALEASLLTTELEEITKQWKTLHFKQSNFLKIFAVINENQQFSVHRKIQPPHRESKFMQQS